MTKCWSTHIFQLASNWLFFNTFSLVGKQRNLLQHLLCVLGSANTGQALLDGTQAPPQPVTSHTICWSECDSRRRNCQEAIIFQRLLVSREEGTPKNHLVNRPGSFYPNPLLGKCSASRVMGLWDMHTSSLVELFPPAHNPLPSL